MIFSETCNSIIFFFAKHSENIENSVIVYSISARNQNISIYDDIP